MMVENSKSIKVVHLCAVDFTVRQFIAPVALSQQQAGYAVQCACTMGPHWDELKTMGLSMVAMPLARSANPFKALRSAYRLYKWLRKSRPDVLHVHTPVASMIGRITGWAAGVPLIIYTAHGFYFHDRMPRKKWWLHVAMEKLFSNFHNALFCVSKEDAEFARKWKFANKSRVFFINNGIDKNRFNPEAIPTTIRLDRRKEFKIPEKATVVCIMGRMVREKGHLELLMAARKLAPKFENLHLLLVGDTVVSEHDDAKEAILRAADAPELSGRVHFTGLRRDIPELLAASDIFCLPTYREGMPVSILEAMMMGLPVVTTSIRGCREEVQHGITGLLVEPCKAYPLEKALETLLKEPLLVQDFGKAGRQRALMYFREDQVLERQLKIYEWLVARYLRNERLKRPEEAPL